MKPKIYVETSVPSFYHEVRKEPELAVRREWTRRWWKHAADRSELVTSPAVLEELQGGDFSSRQDCLDLLAPLRLVPIEAAVLDVVQTYIARRLMPNDPLGDALHLALASFHRCDFLVTWNCRHLANANKFGHIRRVNTLLGLYVPLLVTPLELLGESDDEA